MDWEKMVGLVARNSRLENVRETLRLALQELEEKAASSGLPEWWSPAWERYVEGNLDDRAGGA